MKKANETVTLEDLMQMMLRMSARLRRIEKKVLRSRKSRYKTRGNIVRNEMSLLFMENKTMLATDVVEHFKRKYNVSEGLVKKIRNELGITTFRRNGRAYWDGSK